MEYSSSLTAAQRRLVILCGLLPAIVLSAVALYRPAFVAALDSRVYDALVRRAPVHPPSGRVVIVDVDDKSLAAIGQWPWRRDLIGRFIDRLRQLGSAVIALDVIFAEPDRSSPTALPFEDDNGARPPASNGPTTPDAVLADSLRGGHVVLGYGLTFERRAHDSDHCVLHPLGLAIVEPAHESSEAALFRASGVVCSLPILSSAAAASGFLNAVPDPDGVLRRVPLLMEYDGRVFPALTLAAVLSVTAPREATLQVTNANAASLVLDRLRIPLDGRGNLTLRYRRPKKAFPSVSALDVMHGQVPQETFRDKIVLVGATALGMRDAVTTPLDTLVAGIEVQATVADNLLQEDFISRPASAAFLEASATLLLGIAVTALCAWIGVGWTGVAAVAAVVATWAGAAWMLSASGMFLSPLIPTLGLTLALAVPAFASFDEERRRAERTLRERDVAQDLMIQSLLSLSEIHDAETGRHSRRTQRYAAMLAAQLASHPRFSGYLTPERIDLLASLAPLHDIGKVGIPGDLLNKPGKLTAPELAEMRKHPAHGREAIVKAEERVGVHDDTILAMAKEIVYTHHERWDGGGYPEGLQAERIPIPGRIVALVDVYDALTTRRVYRSPMTHEMAVELIVEGGGTHFDPAVVEAFLRVAPAFQSISVREAGAVQAAL